jgi:hypothetical protein
MYEAERSSPVCLTVKLPRGFAAHKYMIVGWLHKRNGNIIKSVVSAGQLPLLADRDCAG